MVMKVKIVLVILNFCFLWCGCCQVLIVIVIELWFILLSWLQIEILLLILIGRWNCILFIVMVIECLCEWCVVIRLVFMFIRFISQLLKMLLQELVFVGMVVMWMMGFEGWLVMLLLILGQYVQWFFDVVFECCYQLGVVGFVDCVVIEVVGDGYYCGDVQCVIDDVGLLFVCVDGKDG